MTRERKGRMGKIPSPNALARPAEELTFSASPDVLARAIFCAFRSSQGKGIVCDGFLDDETKLVLIDGKFDLLAIARSVLKEIEPAK
jgi:hypothetical protein